MYSVFLALRPASLIAQFLDTRSVFQWSAVSHTLRLSIPRGLRVFTYQGDWCPRVAVALSRCPNLQRLRMAGPFLASDALLTLVTVLVECPTLRSIDFSDTILTVLGVKALLAVLYRCTALESVDFGGNDISRLGWDTFAGVFRASYDHSISLHFRDRILSMTVAPPTKRHKPNCL